jgi:hypothetical protein
VTDIAAGSAADRAVRLEQAVVLLAALSWVAAIIHAVVVPEHWHEYRPYAVCFAVLAAAQAGWSIAVFRDPTPRLLRAGAVLCAGVVAVWAVSRTVGMPVGPEAGSPEPVGAVDVAATFAELAIVGVVAAFWRDWPEVDVAPWVLKAGTAILVGAGVVVTLGGHAH